MSEYIATGDGEVIKIPEEHDNEVIKAFCEYIKRTNKDDLDFSDLGYCPWFDCTGKEGNKHDHCIECYMEHYFKSRRGTKDV